MKFYKIIFSILITVMVAWSCTEDAVVVPEIAAPSSVKANLMIATDGSGIVKGTPTADGANTFEILFGDVTGETPTVIEAGKSFEHVYQPGDYSLKITGIGMTGLRTQATEAIKMVAVAKPLNLPIDFESAQVAFTFTDFGGATSSVVDNPQKAGINSSNKVATSNKSTGSEVFAGSFLTLEQPIDFSSKKGFKMMVWSPKPGIIVKLKVENLTDGNIGKEVDVTTTKTNEWEELSYGFADVDISKTYQKVVVFFDFGVVGQNTDFYFDNIVQIEPPVVVTPVAAPTTLAPKPTLAAVSVISLFSDAYTGVTVDTWRTEWSVADYTEVTINGEKVKKYSKLNFVGIETVKNTINASAMTHFHTDFWTGDATEFKIKLVDFGANGIFDGGGDDVEHELVFSNIEKNKWVSLDLPLSDFTGLTTRSHIAQFIYAAAPSGSNTVFIDNIYFHK
jgi:hypothetical protein